VATVVAVVLHSTGYFNYALLYYYCTELSV
jgi:hypothetical protein